MFLPIFNGRLNTPPPMLWRGCVFHLACSIIAFLSFCTVSSTLRAQGLEQTRQRCSDVFSFSLSCSVVSEIENSLCTTVLDRSRMCGESFFDWETALLVFGFRQTFGLGMQVLQSCGFLWHSSLPRNHFDPENNACKISNSYSEPHWNVSSTQILMHT